MSGLMPLERSVELRDVWIPTGLEDAMSRKAQADREMEARLILAQSETLVAREMEIASQVYANNPTGLQLRAMNMTYESIEENSTLMVFPSSLIGSMDPIARGAAMGNLRLETPDPAD
jgi:regulator of protease activity HflC (stomatin/prohibitin superfamily)